MQRSIGNLDLLPYLKDKPYLSIALYKEDDAFDARIGRIATPPLPSTCPSAFRYRETIGSTQRRESNETCDNRYVTSFLILRLQTGIA